MIDLQPPPIVQQLPAISQSDVLIQYSRYHYGLCPLRHTSEQLGQYADAARRYGLATIAEGFEKLVDWAEREEESQRLDDAAEYQAHVDHLRRNYR